MIAIAICSLQCDYNTIHQKNIQHADRDRLRINYRIVKVLPGSFNLFYPNYHRSLIILVIVYSDVHENYLMINAYFSNEFENQKGSIKI